MARCWNPRCRAHTRTRPRAPTNALPRTRAKTSSGSRSAEYVNQLSTSSVLPRALRRAATSAPAPFALFRPFSAPFFPAVLSLSPPPLFSEALPHSPPLQPPEVSVCFGTDAIPPCFNDRPPLQLFLTRAGCRGIARRALCRELRLDASHSILALISRASFETKPRVSRGLRGAKFVSRPPSTSSAANLFTRVAAKLPSRKPLPGVVSRLELRRQFRRCSRDWSRWRVEWRTASPKEILQRWSKANRLSQLASVSRVEMEAAGDFQKSGKPCRHRLAKEETRVRWKASAIRWRNFLRTCDPFGLLSAKLWALHEIYRAVNNYKL